MFLVFSILFGALFAAGSAWALGSICLRSLAVPRVVAFAVGAALESCVVFLLLLAGVANTAVFTLFGTAAMLLSWRLRGSRLKDPVTEPPGRPAVYLLAAIFAVYGVLYLVNALAPEIEPDGFGYHLGLVSEYLRLGRFPGRVGFFEMVPQGMEMLFLVAFAFGRHSAAKLLHFLFLLATVPLFVGIGRRLRLADTISLAAAAIYFCAPVVGVSGASAYNDAALVFFILTTFYLLLIWRERQDDRYLVPAGIAAGFCYAIKLPGAVAVPAALLFVIATHWKKPAKALRPLLFLTAPAAAMALPWILRDVVLCGNPLAPLFNSWFPNRWFHAASERDLARALRTYEGFRFRNALAELSFIGRNQGIIGPLFLAFPLGLLALRRRAGRWCWAAALLLALPWFWNVGTRFLMPALPFLALAFVMVLPRPAALACLVFHAVTCWPQVVDRYDRAQTWRLHGVPWRSALRIEPEPRYLWRKLDEYKIARMVEGNTQPGDKIFALIPIPAAYLPREALVYWHSAKADILTDSLKLAAPPGESLYEVKAAWPARLLRDLRFRLGQAHPGEWCIHEIRLYSDDARVYASPHWLLKAWPNPWEVPLAFDGNPATHWRTWESMRAGMFLEADLDRPQLLTGATLLSHTPAYGVPVEVYGLGTDGQWRRLSAGTPASPSPQDLRKAAVDAVRDAGYSYILAPAGDDGLGPLGKQIVGHEGEWSLERVDQAGPVYLFRIL